MKEELITHLKREGLDDERIEKILSIIPIEEAYENLQKNNRLKKTVNCTGLEEWPKEMNEKEIREIRKNKGLVTENDIEIVSRSEDRTDHTMSMIERILKIIESKSHEIEGED